MYYFKTEKGYYYKENAKGEKKRISQKEFSKKSGGVELNNVNERNLNRQLSKLNDELLASPPANNNLRKRNTNTSRRVNSLNVGNQVTINSLYSDKNLVKELPARKDLILILNGLDKDTKNKVLEEIKNHYLNKFISVRKDLSFRDQWNKVKRATNQKSVISLIIKNVKAKMEKEMAEKRISELKCDIELRERLARLKNETYVPANISLWHKCDKLEEDIKDIRNKIDIFKRMKILSDREVSGINVKLIQIESRLKRVSGQIPGLVNTVAINHSTRERALRFRNRGLNARNKHEILPEQLEINAIEMELIDLTMFLCKKSSNHEKKKRNDDNLQRRLKELKKYLPKNS